VGDDKQFIAEIDGFESKVCIDIFGGEELLMPTAKGDVLFEWSAQFGPQPIKKGGAGRDLPPRHPFWRAASLWNLQGRRMMNGKCFWHEPKKPVLKHLGGRNYLIIEDGEAGHDW
jgi:hypothetical protein